MPERSLRVQLVRHTGTPQDLVALGARLCYAGGTLDSLVEKISSNDQEAFVQKVMGMGHDSVLEHASFTFLVEGVSRVLLAQLTRHRIASFRAALATSFRQLSGLWARRPWRSTKARWLRFRAGTKAGSKSWAMPVKRATRMPASCCPALAKPGCCSP